MKKTNSNVKYIISLIVSVSIGSFFTDILERIDINVWFARIIGGIICVIVGLLFIRVWIKDYKKK